MFEWLCVVEAFLVIAAAYHIGKGVGIDETTKKFEKKES